MTNVFQIASRKKFRFPSVQGHLPVELLWELPLTTRAKHNASLDDIAKQLNRTLKEQEEESFVSTSVNHGRIELEQKLELVKEIIQIKLDEKEKAQQQAKRKEEKEKLLQILENKEEEKLTKLSEEEIHKRLKELAA